MLDFTENIKITVNLLSHLTDKPQKVSDLAPYCRTTKFMLESVIRHLKTAKLVQSKKGPGGGIFRIPTKISLYNVLRAFYPDPVQNQNDMATQCSKHYIQFLKQTIVQHENIETKQDLNPIPATKNTKPPHNPPTTMDQPMPDPSEFFGQKHKKEEKLDIKSDDDDFDGSKGW